MNKFDHRTHKTPDETLDYTKNLCYCYDDIENCQGEEIFYVDVDGNRHYPAFKTAATTQQQAFTPPHNTAATPPLPQSAHVELLLDQINHEFEIYVAVVVPKHIGRRVVKYQICREGNAGEDCSEEDIIALFGINENSSHEKTINSESFTIEESLFQPSWKLSKPVEAFIKTWTRIEVSDGSDLIPSQAPPFFVCRFTSDLENRAR